MFIRTLTIALIVSSFALASAQDEPLSFAQALELVQNSPAVTLAASQLTLAQRQLEVASGVVSADLSTGYTQTWGSRSDTSGVESSLNDGGLDAVTLNMTLNVVPFGPTADTVQRAHWNLQEAAAGLHDARYGASLNVAEQYLTALRLSQQLTVDQAAVALAQAELEAAQIRLAAGAETDSGVLAAQIALGQAQSDLADTERDQLDAFAMLAQTLGVAVAAVAGGPAPLSAEVAATLEASETLLQNRSDVLEANLAVLEAKLAKASTVRDYLPSGSVSTAFTASSGDQQLRTGASFDTRSFQPSLSASYDPSAASTSGASSRSFSLSLGLDIPLNSASSSALAVADLTVARSEQQAEQTLQLARLEVESSQRALDAATNRLDLATQLVAQAEEVAQTTQDRFDLGLASVLDVQQAELNLATARLSADRARDARTLAAMQLAQSLALDPTEVF